MIPMDVLSIWVHRKRWDGRNLALLIPSATIGIAIGGFTAGWVNDDVVRLLVGIIAVVFTIYRFRKMTLGSETSPDERRPPPKKRWGIFWGGCAGFTSFLAHAGSPPYQVYVIPQRLSKEVYTGTSVMFFASVNAIKIIPYGMLGQLSVTNLSVSAALLPLVPAGVLIGVWLNRRLPEKIFFSVIMTSIFLVGLKLIWDGIANVLGTS